MIKVKVYPDNHPPVQGNANNWSTVVIKIMKFIPVIIFVAVVVTGFILICILVANNRKKTHIKDAQKRNEKREFCKDLQVRNRTFECNNTPYCEEGHDNDGVFLCYFYEDVFDNDISHVIVPLILLAVACGVVTFFCSVSWICLVYDLDEDE